MAQYVTHITALRCGTGVPVAICCWPAEDYALTVLQPRLPELGVLQLLEQGVPVGEQPLVLSLEAASPQKWIARRDTNHVGGVSRDQDDVGEVRLPHVLGNLLQGAVHHHDSHRVHELCVQLFVVPAEGADLLDDLCYCSQCVVVGEIIQRAPDQTIGASHDAIAPRCRRCGTSRRLRSIWCGCTGQRSIASKENELVALPVVEAQRDAGAFSNPLSLPSANDKLQHLGHGFETARLHSTLPNLMREILDDAVRCGNSPALSAASSLPRPEPIGWLRNSTCEKRVVILGSLQLKR